MMITVLDSVVGLRLAGRVVGPALAWELVDVFVNARFGEEKRFLRRLDKPEGLEAVGTKGNTHA